ncbi:MAG: DinB family protein [Planctomycetota bacterium]
MSEAPDRAGAALLRHFLAALAYRTQKALRDAPPEFADFRAAPNVRTPRELVWHMTGVIGYARTQFTGGVWRPDLEPTFDAEVERFHEVLEDTARHLDKGQPPAGFTFAQLLQGPFADAMTHAGQLAMLRRLCGAPVPPENFLLADVRGDNLGAEQPAPRAPKEGWRPDQPPPAPGRPLR